MKRNSNWNLSLKQNPDFKNKRRNFSKVNALTTKTIKMFEFPNSYISEALELGYKENKFLYR
jgi:hypothetical protein